MMTRFITCTACPSFGTSIGMFTIISRLKACFAEFMGTGNLKSVILPHGLKFGAVSQRLSSIGMSLVAYWANLTRSDGADQTFVLIWFETWLGGHYPSDDLSIYFHARHKIVPPFLFKLITLS